MERTRKKVKQVSAILTSDWHLREDTPTCFIGDWNQEQWKAIEFIRHLQYQYKCPVLHAGDLFHHWKPSPALISQALYFIPEDFHTIYGQHDLPQHNWELRDKSGLHTLKVAGKLTVLGGVHWGQSPVADKDGGHYVSTIIGNKRILVWHNLTYLNPPYPGATGGMAEGILRKYPSFDLILTGDNHQQFDIEYQGRKLVNPGNITRQTADQIDFKPAVYLYYAEDNSVERVHLPIQDAIISREHIDIKEKRDERIHAFVSHLSDDWQAEMSFEDNLVRFEKANNIRKPIMDIVYKALE